MKKKIGIISGMGTRAGLFFVDKLINLTNANSDQEFPEFILHNNSQIPDRSEAINNGGESPLKELQRSLKFMNDNQVEIIVATCITSYVFFNQLNPVATLQLLNPIDLVLNKIKKDFPSVKSIGLLATTGTINSGLFHKPFIENDFEIITLGVKDQEQYFMQSIYMKNGLKSSEISEYATNLFKISVNKMLEKPTDLIIGACSEVQIGLKNFYMSTPYIDVMDVLAENVIIKYYQNDHEK